MGFCRVPSAGLIGLEAVPVDVEVDAYESSNSKGILIVGLPDTVVRESRDRVFAAIKHTRHRLGDIKCTVNLAPSDLKKEGAFYDLPIALGLLSALRKVTGAPFEDYLVIGELGLNGDLRPIRGALAVALLARNQKKKGIVLPQQNAFEAAAVPGIEVIPVASLGEAIAFFGDPTVVPTLSAQDHPPLLTVTTAAVDFSEIRGQSHVKRAMEIAAAGGHNILLIGPPGSGKTMLAKALIGIMPEMSLEEALEVTRIHSVAGLLKDGQSLVAQRPFRSPHHTVSYAGLIGGGNNPKPGEVSLAHNGILFLDELPEFSRATLEVLRQPLEDRQVTISRANGRFTFPTQFLCVAAMNPCPCGFEGHPDKMCVDTDQQVRRYRSKISGPLLDRLDMVIEVPQLRYQEFSAGETGEKSATIRERVKGSRAIQRQRLGRDRTNATIRPRELKKYCLLNQESHEQMRHAVDVMGISARAHDRLLRVARTIADLDHAANIETNHLMEAINYRLSWSDQARCA